MDDRAFAKSFRCGIPMSIIKYILAVIVAIALAEAIPEAVNAILILILVGVVLMQFDKFAQLVNLIGSVGK
jgi:hypothetical protein